MALIYSYPSLTALSFIDIECKMQGLTLRFPMSQMNIDAST
jgi:hypothetical protein